LTEIISLDGYLMRRISDVKPVGGRFILVPLRGRRDSQDGRPSLKAICRCKVHAGSVRGMDRNRQDGRLNI
jgi:hypothetical protein